MNEPVKLILVDDHVMLRKGLACLLEKLGYRILRECSNGQELTESIKGEELPDIVLMDINMPVMDGYEATFWMKEHFPSIHVLALSMYEEDLSIIRVLRYGAKGYVIKESEPEELKSAIDNVISKGFHYSELVTGSLLHSIGKEQPVKQELQLSDREREFLKLASTEMTYKEIAEEMHLSPRTIDGYRDALFEKLNVKSRVGLVLFALKHRIVHLN